MKQGSNLTQSEGRRRRRYSISSSSSSDSDEDLSEMTFDSSSDFSDSGDEGDGKGVDALDGESTNVMSMAYNGSKLQDAGFNIRKTGRYILKVIVHLRNSGKSHTPTRIAIMVDEKKDGGVSIQLPPGKHPVNVKAELDVQKGQKVWTKLEDKPSCITACGLEGRLIMAK